FPRDFQLFFKDGANYDGIITVSNESNKESFKIHQTVLLVRCRSLYNELLGVDYNDEHVKKLRKPDIPIIIFRIII
ncbi:20022_t:CDS:1, partial [Racocetra persica]